LGSERKEGRGREDRGQREREKRVTHGSDYTKIAPCSGTGTGDPAP
jgi:hypothetical protein